APPVAFVLVVTGVRTASGAHPASNRVGEAARQVIVRTRLPLVPRHPHSDGGRAARTLIGCPR
ncbi:MAG: hypothetical protein M3680_20545, partial [Myxococcota bacterium]|nr:hypothetical protein [Myxococcota bacterium]